MGQWKSITLLNFLRLTTMILDYLQYTHPLPYLTSIFPVAWKMYLIRHCMGHVRLQLIVSCVACIFSNQNSLLIELWFDYLKFCDMKSVYFLCASWIFLLYLSLGKWTPLNFQIFLRKPGNIIEVVLMD